MSRLSSMLTGIVIAFAFGLGRLGKGAGNAHLSLMHALTFRLMFIGAVAAFIVYMLHDAENRL